MSKNNSFVLLVSDAQTVIDTFKSLKLKSHRFLCVTTEKEALNHVIEYEIHIEAVFIDMDASEYSGINCLKRLRKISYFPQFIALTNSADIEVLSSYLLAGANDYLPRNPSRAKLIEVIQKLDSRFKDFNSKVLTEIERLDRHWPQKQVEDLIYLDNLRKRLVTYDVLLFSLTESLDSDIVPSKTIQVVNYKEDRLTQSIKVAIQNDIQTEVAQYKATIVVVDELNGINDLKTIFKDSQYRVFFTTSVEKGLDFLSENKANIVMVNMSLANQETIEQIKKTNPDCNVMALLEKTDFELTKQAVRKGVFRCVFKPFSELNLFYKIKESLTWTLYPELIEKSIQKLKAQTLCFDSRLAMFEQMCEERSDLNLPIRLKDVYIFFEEIKKLKLRIPKSTTFLSSDILKMGIKNFLITLPSRKY